jgi:hypothetical protein
VNEQNPPQSRGYISSMAPRPHALTPPALRPSRAAELRAALLWTFRSWLRPADTQAARAQQDGS